MTNRFRDLETLQQATRARLPGAAASWLAALRAPLEKLTVAALDPRVSDRQFRRLVFRFNKSLPGLLEKLDHDSLAKVMEDGMGAAMAGGIARRKEHS